MRDEPRAGRRSITVLASHVSQSQSMRRYGELLADSYRRAGWDVEVRRPMHALTDRVHSNLPHKLLAYVEKLVLFPLQLVLRPPGSIVHLTDHSDAPWLRSLRRSTAAIVTCHDLIAIRAGAGDVDVYRPRWTGRLYQRYISASLERADLIAAVSESTLADVRRSFPTKSARLLHNPLMPGITESSPAAAESKAGPYLLLVAASGWRKRRHRSIEVWRRLREAEPELRLIVVGDELEPVERDAAGLPTGTEPGLEFHTDVSNSALVALYAGAVGLLMMSSHEGFGWPVAEANFWGIVAACTDIPVFHEVGPHNVFIGEDLDAVDWSAVRARIDDPATKALVRQDAARFSPAVFQDEVSALAIALLRSTGHPVEPVTEHATASE